MRKGKLGNQNIILNYDLLIKYRLQAIKPGVYIFIRLIAQLFSIRLKQSPIV